MGEFLDVDQSASDPPSRPSPGDRRSVNPFVPRTKGIYLSWGVCWAVESTRATQPRSCSLLFASAGKLEGFLAGIHPTDTDYPVPGNVLNEHSLTVLRCSLWEVSRSR